MQVNWSHLRTFLTVAETGQMKAAAARLKMDATTISRQVQALEQALGKSLLQRGSDGTWHVTDAGMPVQAHARKMAEEAAHLDTEQGQTHVRLSAVPVVMNRVIVPHLLAFLQDRPHLNIVALAQSQNVDLTLRDADIALRLGQPQEGGQHVLSRRIGSLDYCVVRANGARDDLPWITYADGFDHLPQAAWLARQTPRAPIAVADADSAAEAVAAGLGRTLVPRLVAQQDARLQMEDAPDDVPSRPIWLAVHKAARARASVGEVLEWLEALIAGQTASEG